MMTWPAFYNGYPLLYPDSMTYLEDGRVVARAVFLHQLSDYYGMRSFLYSLVILPLHRNVTPWPVLAFQALLTAWVLWLVVRSLLPRNTEAGYLALVAALSLGTSLSWYASLVMPDVLGPVLYLCAYLLVFARGSLSPWERVGLLAIAWWGAAAHFTHMVLAAGLCVVLALGIVLRRRATGADLGQRLRGLGEVAAMVALAAVAQLALHGYLYGKPSLDGERPPFLTARVIADGPGRWYLEQHCGEVKWAMCAYVGRLPDDVDNFLWADDGIWQAAPEDVQQRMLEQEKALVMATLRAYPEAQTRKSAENFGRQLISFGYRDLGPNSYVLEEMDLAFPGSRASYLRGRQSRDAMPREWFGAVQNWVVMGSVVVIVLLGAGFGLGRFWQARPGGRLGWLAVVIITVVVGNAALTGPVSMVDDRFEARVIWLVPLLAGLFLLAAGERRRDGAGIR